MSHVYPEFSDPVYRIESRLGSGGGGVVYKAWHTRLEKYVVIKELRGGSDHDLETQRNEVEALKNVRSAYLPQVYDFIRDRDRVYTVIDFIEGESLDKCLERGVRFPQPQVVKWYGQLASALEVLHNKNICHRDIKPANIMLTPHGDVCLIDFNAALVSGNDVRLISRSLGYASPEQYEVYEHYKKARGESLVSSSGMSAGNQFTYDSKTEYVDDQMTEVVDDNIDFSRTEMIVPSRGPHIDWKRSDVYSLAATIYHLLSGKAPHQKATNVIPLSKLGRFSEGIVYVIEQSMRINPDERFASASVLGDVLKNIHKHDSRWRLSQSRKVLASIMLPLALILSISTTIFGSNMMAQEKEERYYKAVYSIESSADPFNAYHDALEMFQDRIDPYRAMAERLWNDGDIDVCRTYIEENLGNIAKFQTIPEASRDFGDIYYILGNCYYFQPGEPDYNMARQYFEISVDYVKDNPIYYRDYAISLARTGHISEAEYVLEEAVRLDLDQDSLSLLSGEIAFSKQEYESALESFDEVISMSMDEYLRYRAYHTSDDILKLLGRPQEAASLLSEALNRIPQNRIPEIMEKLADAYAKAGNYEKAAELFEQLSTMGAPNFNSLQNAAILLQNADKLDRAAEILQQMEDLFPDDYRVPMRQAFLEADRQSKIDVNLRDYSLTQQKYERALELYNQHVKPGESDPEMQQLESLINELREMKWLD